MVSKTQILKLLADYDHKKNFLSLKRNDPDFIKTLRVFCRKLPDLPLKAKLPFDQFQKLLALIEGFSDGQLTDWAFSVFQNLTGLVFYSLNDYLAYLDNRWLSKTHKTVLSDYEKGRRLEIGLGVKQDREAAKGYYAEALSDGGLAIIAQHVEEENAHAAFVMGRIYYYAQGGVQQDLILAEKYFEQAQMQNHSEAEYFLGLLHYQKGEYQAALRCFSSSASAGVREAQYYMGCLFKEGLGVIRNSAYAKRFFTLAADQGQRDAQYSLGIFYEYGADGISINFERALECYEKAAKGGHPEAEAAFFKLEETFKIQECLSYISYIQLLRMPFSAEVYYERARRCELGLGTEKNLLVAQIFYQKAFANGGIEIIKKEADRHKVNAEFAYGRICYLGQEKEERDFIEAKIYFSAAANKGHREAYFFLGKIAWKEKDYTKAKNWLTRAAEAGVVEALTALRNMREIKEEEEAGAGFAKGQTPDKVSFFPAQMTTPHVIPSVVRVPAVSSLTNTLTQ